MEQFQRLIEAVNNFRDARDWRQFHNPKDLALSLVLEAGEVLEHFQWKNGDKIKEYLNGDGKKELSKELADVLIYLLFLASDLGVDLERAVLEKLVEQNRKYPVEKARGVSTKYDKL